MYHIIFHQYLSTTAWIYLGHPFRIVAGHCQTVSTFLFLFFDAGKYLLKEYYMPVTRSHDDSPISSSSTGPPTPPSMPASRGPVAHWEFWQEPSMQYHLPLSLIMLIFTTQHSHSSIISQKIHLQVKVEVTNVSLQTLCHPLYSNCTTFSS